MELRTIEDANRMLESLNDEADISKAIIEHFDADIEHHKGYYLTGKRYRKAEKRQLARVEFMQARVRLFIALETFKQSILKEIESILLPVLDWFERRLNKNHK